MSLGEKNSAEYIRETASKRDLDRNMAKTKSGVVSYIKRSIRIYRYVWHSSRSW